MLPWVLYALVVVSVLTLAEGLSLLLVGDPAQRSRLTKERLQRHATRVADLVGDDTGTLIRSDETSSWIARLTGGIARRRQLELLLYGAGMPYTMTQFFLLSFGLAVAGPIVGLLLLDSIALAFALCLVGVLPLLNVIARRRRRINRFEGQLPEALDLICRALRAGISLEFGFRSVGDEIDDPAGTEFGQVADEISLGLDTRMALQNLARRMDTRDMPFFVNAILIQRETGGNLAEILDNLSRLIRERVKFNGKVKALTAQVNLQANLLALMPIGFAGLLSFMIPGYLEPLTRPPGLYLAYATGVLLPVGWLICRRIASVQA